MASDVKGTTGINNGNRAIVPFTATPSQQITLGGSAVTFSFADLPLVWDMRPTAASAIRLRFNQDLKVSVPAGDYTIDELTLAQAIDQMTLQLSPACPVSIVGRETLVPQMDGARALDGLARLAARGIRERMVSSPFQLSSTGPTPPWAFGGHLENAIIESGNVPAGPNVDVTLLPAGADLIIPLAGNYSDSIPVSWLTGGGLGSAGQLRFSMPTTVDGITLSHAGSLIVSAYLEFYTGKPARTPIPRTPYLMQFGTTNTMVQFDSCIPYFCGISPVLNSTGDQSNNYGYSHSFNIDGSDCFTAQDINQRAHEITAVDDSESSDAFPAPYQYNPLQLIAGTAQEYRQNNTTGGKRFGAARFPFFFYSGRGSILRVPGTIRRGALAVLRLVQTPTNAVSYFVAGRTPLWAEVRAAALLPVWCGASGAVFESNTDDGTTPSDEYLGALPGFATVRA